MTCAFSKWCFDWSGHSQENSDAKPYSNSPFPKQMIQHRWCFPSRCHGCHREREICACGSPPLVLWSVLLVFLSHVGHAHVGVEPVDLAWLDVAEAEAETCHTFHLVDVHDLLYDPLRRKKNKKPHTRVNTIIKILVSGIQLYIKMTLVKICWATAHALWLVYVFPFLRDISPKK